MTDSPAPNPRPVCAFGPCTELVVVGDYCIDPVCVLARSNLGLGLAASPEDAYRSARLRSPAPKRGPGLPVNRHAPRQKSARSAPAPGGGRWPDKPRSVEPERPEVGRRVTIRTRFGLRPAIVAYRPAGEPERDGIMWVRVPQRGDDVTRLVTVPIRIVDVATGPVPL